MAEDLHNDHEPSGRKISQVNKAARQLFLNKGFAATSMDAVAREANVSKATLYSYFSSKEELFSFLIEDECNAFRQNLVMPTLAEGLEAGLRRFAHEYVGMFLTAGRNSLVSILATESSRFPDMCVRFYQTGPMATTRLVADLLVEARTAGIIDFTDPITAATQFLCLVRADLPIQSVLGIQQLANDSVARNIEAGLATFMKAHRVTQTAL